MTTTTNNSIHQNYKEQISQFSFQLTRKKNDVELSQLGIRFDLLMTSLKMSLSKCDDNSELSKFIDYFAILYKLIAYVRDIYEGKGERNLAYMMIYVWYKHFPVPGLYALKMMTMGDGVVLGTKAYGSWKDIKYFCRYVRDHSPKGVSDPLIETCIGLLNHQFVEDVNCWDKVWSDYLEEESNPMRLIEIEKPNIKL